MNHPIFPALPIVEAIFILLPILGAWVNWQHSRQEVHGDLFDYMARFARLDPRRIPYFVRDGFVAGIAVLLPAFLTVAAFKAWWDPSWLCWIPGTIGVWVAIRLGCLIGDCVFSHWLPHWLQAGNPLWPDLLPNPGIRSTPLMLLEALLLSVTFLDRPEHWRFVIGGALPFAGLFLLLLFGRMLARRRRHAI